MSARLSFETVCPNNHNQTLAFSRQEFEDAMKSGGLVLHCNTCGTDWSLSSEDVDKLRKEFAKNSTRDNASA